MHWKWIIQVNEAPDVCMDGSLDALDGWTFNDNLPQEMEHAIISNAMK